MPDWGYDPRLRGSGYRDLETGRILSKDAARGLMEVQIVAGGNVTNTLASMYVDEKISPADWKGAFRQELKDQYITQYVEGKGGRENMTPRDWGSVGGMLAEQYGYMDNFTEQLAESEWSEEYLANRMGLYINSSRQAYERALDREAPARGFTTKTWVTDPESETCEDCETLQGQGEIPVEEPFVSPSTGASDILPGTGDTICLTNCQCHVEYGGQTRMIFLPGESQ